MQDQETSVTRDEAIAAILQVLAQVCPQCEPVVTGDRSNVIVTQRAGYFRLVVTDITDGPQYTLSVHREVSQNRDTNWTTDFSVGGTYGGAGMGLLVYNFDGANVAEKYASALRSGFDFVTRIEF